MSNKKRPAGTPQTSKTQTKVTELKKGDNALPVTNAALPEDGFHGRYWDGTTGDYLMPPYEFGLLEKIVEENNALGPCISAYEVNIDGSGYILEKDGVEVTRDDNDTSAMPLFDYFDEISPGMSLTTLRKKMRRTLEITGNAFIEVVRNVQDEIMFLNLLPTNMMRLVKLGAPVTVTRNIKRFGKNLPVTMQVRERKYVQKIEEEFIYFREFGSSRNVDKKTGDWKEAKMLLSERGNEIIHLMVDKAANSPYGVPRWVSQAPSAIGSRKAEELNLDFFKAGGVPPVVVFISGGMVGETVRKQLENVFNATASNTNRGAVVEVQPSGGSLDKEGKADINVERFGAESQKDSMFELYDDKCEKRVRKAFRLPPLFVGLAQEYNYASAYASYLVAEAQIFSPEREEWDERFNATIMKAIAPGGEYTYKSKQIGIKDVDTQLKGLTHLKGMSGIDEKAWVSSVNEVTGINVTYDETIAQEDAAFKRELMLKPFEQTVPSAVSKMDKLSWIQVLVDNFAKATGVMSGNLEEDTATATMVEVTNLGKEDKAQFDKLFALRLFPGGHYDLVGAEEVCSCLLDHGEIK